MPESGKRKRAETLRSRYHFLAVQSSTGGPADASLMTFPCRTRSNKRAPPSFRALAAHCMRASCVRQTRQPYSQRRRPAMHATSRSLSSQPYQIADLNTSGEGRADKTESCHIMPLYVYPNKTIRGQERVSRRQGCLLQSRE